jgi:hypothetical protein
MKRCFEALEKSKRDEYGEEYLLECQRLSFEHTKSSWDPKNVVNTLSDAVTLVEPDTQYIVGIDAKFKLLPLLLLPANILDGLISSTIRSLVPLAAANGRGGREGRSKSQ